VQENINNEFQIKRWDEMGADKITISVLDANRNFALLRKMRKKTKCDLQLIANLKCLLGCHAYRCHSNLHAHGSQSDHTLKGFLIDYYTAQCNYTRLNNPTEFIKSLWIRPEDVHYYEEVGVKWLKLVGREMESAKIIRIFNAYKAGKYDGNLLDLLPSSHKNFIDYKKIRSFLKYFFRPQHVNIFSLLQARSVFKEDGVFIDNRRLDGFLEYFRQGRCNLACGNSCNYCQAVAERVVSIDYKCRDKVIVDSRVFLNKLINANIYRYL
jgi:collagenase-like PrtC family protease